MDNRFYIDSHAHLSRESEPAFIDAILERAKQAHVTKIVNICTDKETMEKGIELAKRYPWIYNTGATTPHDVEKEGEELFPLFAHHARNGDLVAIGETGLDYYYKHSEPVIQKEFLKRYLRLAKETHLPVVIHCREAFADFFQILDQEYLDNGKHLPGVLHCFTGTLDEAQEVIKRGWYLSLSGIVTFKKSFELHEVAKIVPLENLFIETDTPFLAPQSKRGKPNEPAYIVETAQFIADIKGISVDELLSHTNRNIMQLFKI